MSQEKKQNIKNNIESFLNPFKVSSDEQYNLISMADNYKGKFYLNAKDYKKFYKIYIESINNGVELCLAEKQNEYGPLIIDIDLNQTNENRLYNLETILLIINTFKTVLKSYLFIESDEQLEVALFEKVKPCNKNGKFKDGFHLIFHGLKIHYKLRYLIRDKVVKLLTDNDVFKNYLNSVDSIIDKSVIYTNSWLLPFSKKPEGQLYELSNIYDKNNEFINITKIKKDKVQIINIFSLNTKFRTELPSTIYNENVFFEQIEEEFNNLYNSVSNKTTEK